MSPRTLSWPRRRRSQPDLEKGALYRGLPAAVQRVGLLAIGARFEAAAAPPHRRELGRVAPQADTETGQRGGADRGHLPLHRHLDRKTQLVGLELHQPAVGSRATV